MRLVPFLSLLVVGFSAVGLAAPLPGTSLVVEDVDSVANFHQKETFQKLILAKHVLQLVSCFQ